MTIFLYILSKYICYMHNYIYRERASVLYVTDLLQVSLFFFIMLTIYIKANIWTFTKTELERILQLTMLFFYIDMHLFGRKRPRDKEQSKHTSSSTHWFPPWFPTLVDCKLGRYHEVETVQIPHLYGRNQSMLPGRVCITRKVETILTLGIKTRCFSLDIHILTRIRYTYFNQH